MATSVPTTALLTAMLLGAAGIGCNSVTGAGDLSICSVNCDNGDDGDGDTSGSGSGGGSGATGSGSSTTGGTTQCVWPESGFGTQVGSFVRQNLNWQGYRAGEDVVSDMSVEEYFDCDGSRGINALLFVTSAVWCGNCQAEAQQISGKADDWAAKGIVPVTLMIEKIDSSPADPDTALQWRDSYKLSSDVAADPSFSFAHNGTIGLPLQIIVDPRTMEIVDSVEGYSGQHVSLEALAAQNAAQ